MKNTKIILCCAIVVAVFATACQSVDRTKADLIKKYEKMITLNDYQSACFYLQEYLFLDSNNLGYMDSLARHYIALNNLLAAEEMAKKVVAKQPNNEDMQGVLATVAMQRGDVPTALGIYEKLYSNTKDYKYLYAQGITYVEGGANDRGLAIAEELLAVPDSDIKTLEVNRLSSAGKQQIKLKAAALLIMGAVQLQTEKPNTAKAYEYLKACLELQPDFEVAQNLVNQVFKGKQ